MQATDQLAVFEQLLSDVFDSSFIQFILENATLHHLREVFKYASAEKLNDCLETAINKEQYELCIHLCALIKERKA
jgi:hypothetical protein